MAFLNASGFGFFPASKPYTSLKYLFILTFSSLLYCISLYQFVSATISYFLSRNFSILIVLSFNNVLCSLYIFKRLCKAFSV